MLRSSLLLAALGFLSLGALAQTHADVSTWLTTADRSALLARQPQALHFAPPAALPEGAGAVVTVDESQTFQQVDGFGFALTGGSAELMMRMDAASRAALIRELFGTDENGIGVSYLRLTIGSSDMNESVYTYDDMPSGQQDPKLARFSIAQDRATVIAVLKEILATRPGLQILASPWSAPSWMKSNDDPKGGKLKPENYQVYAQYLVRYLEAMRAEGIPIQALTMQNEPLNPKNTPSMVMEAPEQAAFLADALGPLLEKKHLATKVILYDHNCDRPDYPMTILDSPKAARYVAGSGFHLYEGEISALTEVHDAFPQKGIYFTEQMIIDKPGATELALAAAEDRTVIGAMRNWSRNVLLWNLAADPKNGPHTSNGGCPICEGAVTLDGNTVTRNLAFYTVAQASRFVPPGSTRIASNAFLQGSPLGTLANVAFRTPDGHLALIVDNTAATAQDFSIRFHGTAVSTHLPAGAVATYVW